MALHTEALNGAAKTGAAQTRPAPVTALRHAAACYRTSSAIFLSSAARTNAAAGTTGSVPFASLTRDPDARLVGVGLSALSALRRVPR
jgi:hypothetical protein